MPFVFIFRPSSPAALVARALRLGKSDAANIGCAASGHNATTLFVH